MLSGPTISSTLDHPRGPRADDASVAAHGQLTAGGAPTGRRGSMAQSSRILRREPQHGPRSSPKTSKLGVGRRSVGLAESRRVPPAALHPTVAGPEAVKPPGPPTRALSAESDRIAALVTATAWCADLCQPPSPARVPERSLHPTPPNAIAARVTAHIAVTGSSIVCLSGSVVAGSSTSSDTSFFAWYTSGAL